MNNLFSVFDPQVLFLPVGWVSLFGFFWLFPPFFWSVAPCSTWPVERVAASLNKDLASLFSTWSSPGQLLIFSSFFTCILVFNFGGLLPFVFTPSSHLFITVGLALPMWAGLNAAAHYNALRASFSHLVPVGSPLFLAPLMVLIELTSNLVRPLALSLRLAANLTAGHLLLSLLASAFTLSFSVTFFFQASALLALLTLETGVALVQAYVFTSLFCIYVQEAEGPWFLSVK